MRGQATRLIAMCALALIVAPAFGQTQGDFRTRASGDWSKAQIWQTYNGASWVNTATAPTGTETITVQSTDSVFIDTERTLTGHLINQGIVESDSMLTIGLGGTYEHARDAGSIPFVIWAEGSTLLLTGVVSTAPENRDQDYFNITINTPDQLSNLNFGLNNNTVGGDIRVISTGAARWYLTSAVANEGSTVTLLGDVVVEGGQLATQGTSAALTTFVVDHYGDIIVTGGNFSISRGSQGLGTTTWNLHEGNFSMSNATTQNSTVTPGGARFVFMKEDGVQMLTLGEGNKLSALPIEVAAGTTLDVGAAVFTGSGDFVVRENATLATANVGGISGLFDALYTGADTLAVNSSYVFNGTEAQVTSAGMPATVMNLTINNPAGVTLSQETTINGELRLMAGVFDNTVPFTLGPGGSVVYDGGSLLVSTPNEEAKEVPQALVLGQNYPNPFRGSTVIGYGLPSSSEVSVRVFNLLGQEVRRVSLGRQAAGMHEYALSADGLSAGLYIYRLEAGQVSSTKRMVVLH